MIEIVGGRTRSLNLGGLDPEFTLITTTHRLMRPQMSQLWGPHRDDTGIVVRPAREEAVVSRMEQCDQTQSDSKG